MHKTTFPYFSFAIMYTASVMLIFPFFQDLFMLLAGILCGMLCAYVVNIFWWSFRGMLRFLLYFFPRSTFDSFWIKRNLKWNCMHVFLLFVQVIPSFYAIWKKYICKSIYRINHALNNVIHIDLVCVHQLKYL